MEPTWLRARRGAAALEALRQRELVVDGIRAFFKERDFREVETPLLVRHPGMEPYLEVFETELATARGVRRRAFLTTSPEYAMKKLLAAGLERVFQICKSFRNGEELSARHNPEFTILEWYRAGAEYTVLMEDCEELVRTLAGADRLVYQDRRVDLAAPWERLTVRDAFSRYAGVDLARDDLARVARARGYAIDSETTWEQLYHQLFLNEVEPRLGTPSPTFLYEYPPSLAALARINSAGWAERFELYAGGLELANAFGELVDPVDQRRRLVAEQKERRHAGKTEYDLDEDFVRALDAGVPPSAGIALGVDRLVMLLADRASIRDVLWFPADELFDLAEEGR